MLLPNGINKKKEERINRTKVKTTINKQNKTEATFHRDSYIWKYETQQNYTGV